MSIFKQKKQELFSVSILYKKRTQHIGIYSDIATQKRVKFLCTKWYPGCIIINE